jgi:hypothetical protein
VPRLSVEASVGVSADVVTRFDGRANASQTPKVRRPAHPGASFMLQLRMPGAVRQGRGFGGLDVRWMKAGVLVRGEWLGGRPFDGTETTGVRGSSSTGRSWGR